MKNPDPLERDIEGTVVMFAKARGVLVYKFTSPNRRSVPDRIFFPKNGTPFLIEFKRLGHQSTPAQEVEIAKIRAQGIYVGVCDSVDAGKRVIEERLML